MFLLPFLKYFKPFVWRIAIAIFGMIMVALLSAAPIFIGGQAVKILLHHGRLVHGEKDEAKADDNPETALMTGMLGGETKPKAPKSKGAAAASGGTSGGASIDAPTSNTKTVVRQRLNDKMARWFGSVYTGPRDAIQPVVHAAEARAHRYREWYEAMVAGDAVLVREGQVTPLHFELSAPAAKTTAQIFNTSDTLVARAELGARSAGNQDYTWDATTTSGLRVADGMYRIEIEAQDNAAKPVASIVSMKSPLRALRILVIVLMLTTVIKGFFEFISKYELAHTLFLSNLQIREDIFRNVLSQDYLYFNQNSPGFLHSRINSDVKSVGDILESLMQDGFQQPITLMVMFVILLVLNAQLTLAVLIVVPFVSGILYYFASVLRKNQRKQKKQSDQLSSCLTESLNNIRLVKALGTERLEVRKFHMQSMALFRFMMARRLAKFGSSPVMDLLGSGAIGGSLLLAGYMVLRPQGAMDISELFMYFYTLTRFYRPLKSMANMTNKYQVARVSGERMEQMLALKPTVVEIANPVPFREVNEAIQFDKVGFSYGDRQILTDVNIRVDAGKRVAFVGPSGAGKTTLVNLLARLFDPTAGRILVDGVDLRHLGVLDWREHLAIVTQETFLFDESIATNIAYGRNEPDMARVQAAARAANAHDFIMALDGGKGYKTLVGPTGARLSGGQRQRISIARALYRDPKILILDEATSALDAQAQQLVQQALDHLMRGRTTFIIAHRISTIRNVDCIYVLDQGQVIESGTHDELILHAGHYANIVKRVSGGGSAEN